MEDIDEVIKNKQQQKYKNIQIIYKAANQNFLTVYVCSQRYMKST